MQMQMTLTMKCWCINYFSAWKMMRLGLIAKNLHICSN